MSAKKIITTILAINLALISLTSCGQEIKQNDSIVKPEDTSSEVTTTAPVNSEQEQDTVTTAEEKKIKSNEIKYEKFSKTLQAEKGKLTGDAKTSDKREGYKGDGYVTNITNDKSGWELEFDLPESQYYNISLTLASDKAAKSTITANGNSVGDFITNGSKKFEVVTFDNIYLEKGKVKISMLATDIAIDIDFVKIQASDEIKNLNLDLKDVSLTNQNADYKTQAVYRYISDNFGKKVILGQHDTVGSLAETNVIYETTGKYPAIRMGDLMPFTDDKTIIGEHEIEYATNWSEENGLVSYMWHWTDPMGTGEYYSDKTDFDLSKAVTKEDIADKSIDDIKKLNKDGKVSDECLAIVEDIDKISAKLGELKDAGVPVLWRPLHEASNGYFWWGKDAKSYKWLWNLMYQRQTNYHKLDNLIWVWSAQNADWYVGDDKCDIISMDIYDSGSQSGQINRLMFLHKISGKKPIAMSECGNFPSIQSMADENAMWSFIGQWGGNFLLNSDYTINEDYNTTENLIEIYNNDLTLTREKLPDFDNIAKKLEQDKEESGKESETEKVTTTADSKDSNETESKSEKTTTTKK